MKMWVGLSLALLAFGAHAEDESTPCDNVETEQQNAACAAYNRKTAERELNNAYTDMLERVKAQYADEPAKLKDFNSNVEAAQQLWRQLRDADCAVETVLYSKGSQELEMAENTCLAQRSDERSEYLQLLHNDIDAPTESEGAGE
ncbi:lysozyme inhibitor LprI family protein [Pseudomonas sp. R5(2019)]|uniref:lysozyme inhibitor LprI family protein n=1 Tax=Pseudomonas sp. R5(2019) TaxID=2697566 RepID=UPI0014125FE6|nr:lysozyme inhibitor LprI family protein [Pseudomonas sp. R5(2019)]NBA97912.1 DUF1311 domain-containing protein [Pseudomonas sp. R5(2019)]